MVTARNTREDVVRAAGRLFAARGYHGTSMRDLGRELGLLGSSLYAHVDSKQDLLVDVVEEGARLFEASAEKALATEGTAAARLEALIAGHVDVVIDNIEVSRTFLNEARMLDGEHRRRILEARDHYEEAFRSVIRAGKPDGSFSADIDPKTASIFILSILNAIERWYHPEGEMDRDALVSELSRFIRAALA
ncbi:MAG TPA: TetR/AcrR family transcriptional regulator [Acidimicrobiia bacterium]|nr:TetR/AcrR family transcriptional regulator [Acidimicrobiia bacterium]